MQKNHNLFNELSGEKKTCTRLSDRCVIENLSYMHSENS